MSLSNEVAVLSALNLLRSSGNQIDPRLAPEMHRLLAEHPGLAATPMKLLAGAQVRIGQRDAKSWSKVIEGITP